jgi:hypothetical protein
MAYRVRIDPLALREIERFAEYLRNYSEDFAIEQFERLDRILREDLTESPVTWAYFPLTGAPLSGVSVPRWPPHAILDHLHGRRGDAHRRHPLLLECSAIRTLSNCKPEKPGPDIASLHPGYHACPNPASF